VLAPRTTSMDCQVGGGPWCRRGPLRAPAWCAPVTASTAAPCMSMLANHIDRLPSVMHLFLVDGHGGASLTPGILSETFCAVHLQRSLSNATKFITNEQSHSIQWIIPEVTVIKVVTQFCRRPWLLSAAKHVAATRAPKAPGKGPEADSWIKARKKLGNDCAINAHDTLPVQMSLQRQCTHPTLAC